MSSRIILITGITGQDGSYLAESLIDEGYQVIGWTRPEMESDLRDPLWRIHPFMDRLTLTPVDLTDSYQVIKAIQALKPDHCYHLAAASFVGNTHNIDDAILKLNVRGTQNLLSALKSDAPDCRFFFAGSAEMFGKVTTAPQDEQTPFRPRSNYGLSKVMAYELVRYYREHLNLFTSTGILYNHESPRRGNRFVTRKITTTAAKIKLGKAKELRLGNIEAERDWGFAGDYVNAMRACLNSKTPQDYVIATGVTHSVREFLEIAFGELDLDYREFVVEDPEFYRPKEEVLLVGNAARAQQDLGWTPCTGFHDLVRQMVIPDLDYYRTLL